MNRKQQITLLVGALFLMLEILYVPIRASAESSTGRSLSQHFFYDWFFNVGGVGRTTYQLQTGLLAIEIAATLLAIGLVWFAFAKKEGQAS